MKEATHILDQPLSPSQDFKLLKNKGIEYIQEFVGSEWTNYNPSDPGITILEQVCFALTELGYCSDFPIEDILTTPKEQIEYDDQFYAPEQILTTSPVTIQDYRKLLIDEIEEVVNVFIEPINSAISRVSRAYRVHLYLSPALEEERIKHSQKAVDTKKDHIIKRAFYLLNKNRNWGELFLMPQIFRQKVVEICGVIEVNLQTHAPRILRAIQESFETFVFSGVKQVGYDFLKAQGADANEIFHGPLLKNGWIVDETLKDKCNSISQEELGDLLTSIEGINYLKNIAFLDQSEDKTITASKNQLLVLNLSESILSGNLIVQCNGKNIYSNLDKSSSIDFAPRSSKVKDIGSVVKIKPDLPSGSFRDIDGYYSIQNTFPEAFGVGESGIDSNASDYQIAQSRQLKGFLTLFDQQLANQFSQLANVRRLFSFKNTISGAPSDRKEFYAKQSKLNPEQSEYPAPYEGFSPTYFCQSLYEVPHIQPLLKGNEMFDYSFNPVENDVLKHDSWKQFKNDPYNGYIWGLMQIMGDDPSDVERRNKILDHLLARHGESPMLIDSIIDDKIYTGDSAKGQVIFKSLLLQNLQAISYNRTKSIDFLGADRISDQMVELPNEEGAKNLRSYSIDFVFDSEKINEREKISPSDLNNYSALELKLKLLFALQYIYDHYIHECIEISLSAESPLHEVIQRKAQMASWLIDNRKGQINIEPNLLMKCLTYKMAYRTHGAQAACHAVNESMNYHQALGIEQLFKEDLQQPDVELSESTTIDVSGEVFSVIEVDTCDWAEGLWETIPGTQDEIAIRANLGSKSNTDLNHEIFNYSALFIFPDFVSEINDFKFKSRLDLFLNEALPVHVEHDVLFLTLEQMETLVPLFCAWRNNLRTVDGSTSSQKTPERKLEKSALALIHEVINIYEKNHG